MAFSIEAVVVIAVILFVIVRRTFTGMKGSSYSVRSLFMRPVIYLVLTAFLVIGLLLWQDLAIVIAVIAGALLGLLLGKKSNIFEKDGKIMYKRSNEVTALWIIGFVIRIGIDFVFNPVFSSSSSVSLSSIISAGSAFESSPILLGADLLLAFSAGLLVGEAFVIYNNYNRKYKK